MRTFAVVALFALVAAAMAASPAQTEEKKDLEASPSLLYGGLGLGGIGHLGYGGIGLGLHKGIGLGYGGIGHLGYGGLGYGLGIHRLGLLGGYGLHGGIIG